MLDPRQRHEMLAAMGIELYVLRDVAAPHTGVPDSAGAEQALDVVVASAVDAGGDAAAQRLRSLLPLALGTSAERIRWLLADSGGQLPEPPTARAYLALGHDMPRALGANLSTQQQMAATIAAADEPAASLRDALSKRALWQALKPLARQLRGRLQ